MNSDWLQQVSRIEKSYETLFRDVNSGDAGTSSLIGLNTDDDFKTYHGSNRFPPRARPRAIGGLDNEQYNLYTSDANTGKCI